MKLIKNFRIKDFLFYGICFGVICFFIYPTLKITTYTYPVQDDLHLVTCMRSLREQGYSLISGALYYVVEYYKTFMGAYSAVFLVFVFEDIVGCSQPGIMIFEICSLVLFYSALFLWVFAFIKKLFKLPFKGTVAVYVCMISFVNNVYYYADHEDYYWLDTSILYLGILSLSLISVFCAIMLVDNFKNKKYYFFLFIACFLSFIGSGANLSLSFMNCALHFIALFFIFIFYKEVKPYIWPFVFAILGTFINGIAPGNYIRKGKGVDIGDVFSSLGFSFRFVFERLVTFIKTPIFIITLVILIAIVLVYCEKRECTNNLFIPLCLFLGGIIIDAAVSFPAVIGYTYEALCICMRLMFIIDVMIYFSIILFVVFCVIFLKSRITIERFNKIKQVFIIISFFIAIIMIGRLRNNQWRWTPVVRMYREINNGRFQEYSDYVWNVYNSLYESQEDEVVIYINEVEDKSCLINPYFCFGDHGDEDLFYYDDTIVNFFKKKSLHLYNIVD